MVRKRILEMTLNWSLRSLESEVVTSWKEDDESHFEANELWSWWWPFIFCPPFLPPSFLHSSFLLPSLMRTPSSFYFHSLFPHSFFWLVTKSKKWNVSYAFSFFLQTRLISFLRSIEQFVKNENISLASVQSLCVTSFSSIALRTNGVEEVYERSCVVGLDGKETKKSKTFCSNKASCWILSLSLFSPSFVLNLSLSRSLSNFSLTHPYHQM